MTAFQLFKSLQSEQSFWSAQSRKMLWLAARYYAGVISLDELEGCAGDRIVRGFEGGDGFALRPLLTYGEVMAIVRLR